MSLMYNRPKRLLIASMLFLGVMWVWLFMVTCGTENKFMVGFHKLFNFVNSSKITSWKPFGRPWSTSSRPSEDVTLFSGSSHVIDGDKPVNTSRKQVCYYWIPRHDKAIGGYLTPSGIDPHICSCIIISCAIIQNNTIIPLAEDDIKVYSEVVNLKKQNPNLLVFLCLADGFESLTRDQEAIAIFAFNAHQFLLINGFDGLDLDWEFPGWPAWQKDHHEKKWLTYLVLQLNNALKLASHPPLKLSLAVGAPQSIVDSSYEVLELAKYVDFVSIMGYDYHMYQSYLPFTGHNSPLSQGWNEVGFLAKLNIKWAANYWLQKGMPKEKIVVGIPTYGRTWKLLSEDWYNVGAPAVGYGVLGGVLSYTEACIFIKEGAIRHFDDYSQVPYSVRERDWISHEDAESILAKTKWIYDSGFAGVMTWNLNCDDWAGLCNGKKFELHNLIKDVIHS